MNTIGANRGMGLAITRALINPTRKLVLPPSATPKNSPRDGIGIFLEQWPFRIRVVETLQPSKISEIQVQHGFHFTHSREVVRPN